MKLITVKRQYHDNKLKKTFFPGDTYKVDDKRAALIEKALPGYVSIKEAPKSRKKTEEDTDEPIEKE